MMPFEYYHSCRNANKQELDFQPRIRGGMLEFVCTDYATRERRTRVLIDPSDISHIKELYDPEQYGNRNWCKVFLRGSGEFYEVLSSYDNLAELLASVKKEETK